MMKNLNKENFFFFYDNCSELIISPGSTEHAYLTILNEDLASAGKIFAKIDSPRAKWGSSLISILNGYLEKYPTFFQIRNFLEIDMDFLLRNNKISYVEQLLGSLDFLSTINQEVYKFTARVMFENNLFSAALKYMERAKNIYYKDAELHFMLAKYYLKFNNYSEANYYIRECLKLIPEYFPAIILKEKIEEILL